jgi:isopentenyl diphosphate isomerase/L-lactate dehydrogenase-like FMN-dependent dehydrogenase
MQREHGAMNERRVAQRIHSTDDARYYMHRRLPKFLAQRYEGGSAKGLTLRANEAAFDEVWLLSRSARGLSSVDLTTTLLGTDLSMPVVLAPTGGLQAGHWDGECAAARAAGAAGTALVVSSSTGTPLEEIARAAIGPVFYQLHYMFGRDRSESMIERAKNAGCAGLLLTVDSQSVIEREWGPRNRAYSPASPRTLPLLRALPQVIGKPQWLREFLVHRNGLTVPMAATDDGSPLSVFDLMKAVHHATPVWADIAWIRERWKGPLVIKGLVTVDDARLAVDHGADGIVVSNHGGNTIDGRPATLSVLPRIVDAVGDQCEVLMDGGVRRGSDVVKAVALGARAVLIGRAYVFALMAAGQPGVSRSLEVMRHGLRATMASLGCASVRDLDRSYVDYPGGWH